MSLLLLPLRFVAAQPAGPHIAIFDETGFHRCGVSSLATPRAIVGDLRAAGLTVARVKR